MHERATHDTSNCSIARTLGLVGEKWTLLILREVGFFGVTRFADLQQILGCPRNLLADRLHMLADHGILASRPYKEPGKRTRNHYVLTDKGSRLVPALIGLLQWGDEYLCDTAGPSAYVDHRGCEHHVRLEMRCDHGHKIQSTDDLEMTPGPGFRLAQSA